MVGAVNAGGSPLAGTSGVRSAGSGVSAGPFRCSVSRRASSRKALRSTELSAGAWESTLGGRSVAADAEAAIAAEYPLAVEHRQAGQFHCQALFASAERPCHDEPAPGLMRGERARHLALGIEAKRCGDVGPGLTQQG